MAKKYGVTGMVDFSKEDRLVSQYVEQGDTETAVKLLFKLIVKYAGNKNFARAEMLKEQIYEVNPLALNEIIKAGEIIDEEKSKSIDQNRLALWSDLCDGMSTEEINTLFFAMKEATLDTNQTIYRQGALNSRLYFIEQGQVKLIFRHKDRESLLKNSGPGSIVGIDTFYSSTVCTTSLITHSPVRLSYLDRDVYLKWQTNFRLLASKLKDYCKKLEKTDNLFKKKNSNRRVHKRIKIPGNVTFQVLNDDEKPVSKDFSGSLADISNGGLSFIFRISDEENARHMLGQKLNIELFLNDDNTQHHMEIRGTIVGVIFQFLGDYSIHVKFDEKLSEADIAALIFEA
jgi:CRP-like cAMP-binding protein